MIKTFYTIQDFRAWTTAQRTGFLSGNPEFIDPDFINPYCWIVAQMEKRLTVYEGEYPIWLWSKKPDLRRAGYLKRSTKAVLLEIEIPSDRVLLSDFQAWHCVLNRWTLEDHEGEVIEMEKSWERIFDLEYLKKHPDWGNLENWTFRELPVKYL
jgi:hypothetical protein